MIATSSPSQSVPRRSRLPNNAWVYVVLTIGGIITAFPFVWMFLTSLKTFSDVFQPGILPTNPTLENYAQVLERTGFLRWFLNSVGVALVTTLSVLFFDSLVGYTLAKMRFPGKEIIFVIILSTVMIPTEMLVIPWYVGALQLRIADSYLAIALPGLISAFGVFLMRGFFEGIPDELFDAARVDGMGEFGLFTRVGLPLVKPALAALGIFTFLGNYNAFLWPLIIIQSAGMRTLPVGIALFSGESGAQWQLIMAASSLAVIPVLLVFVVFQRQIIEGVVLTGVKG
ncbi:MAG: carbohydrate ABC transporter permease [Pleurocapsa sp. SU_196_0]|nr:carbohydrate ABC transporter permease [Pleurocapsa sp. SU_196_0]